MPALNRLLYLQAGMQAQVFGNNLQRMHGFLLQPSARRRDEQAVFVYPRWIIARTEHAR
jgi:hypothetical protein